MKYHNWNHELISSQLVTLNKLYEETKNEEILKDLRNLRNLRTEQIEIFPIEDDFRAQVKEDLASIRNYSSFLDDIRAFSKLDAGITIPRQLVVDELNIKEAVALGFAHDFFNHIDKEFGTIFNKLYRERKNNIRFTDIRSFNQYLPTLDYSYINIEKSNTIEEFTSTVHEYMHSIVDKIYYRYDYFSTYPFVEVPSIFMEMISLDELIDSFMNFDNDRVIAKAAGTKTILNYSKDIISLTNFYTDIDMIKRRRRALIDLAKYLNIKKKEARSLLSRTLNERFAYTIPFLTAVELYYIYQVDPEYAIYLLKKIIKMDYSDDYNESLKDIGIYLNEHTEEYISTLSKELKNMKQ